VKTERRTRSILHVDLDPFLVSVERSLDPGLRGRPVIVGGDLDGSGIVAAVSAEARKSGVRPGQTVPQARRLCPDGVFRPGDLDAYARMSEDVTALLCAASRRVERPSADEAYVDLTRDGPGAAAPVPAAEALKDEIQRRLGLDASLGLATTRLAARVASTWARPRGLLVVLPGYEAKFLARQPLSFLPDLPPHLEAALEKAGLKTLGDVGGADPDVLRELVGTVAAEKLQTTARGEGEDPIAVATPPVAIQEEAVLRDPRTDRAGLEEMLEGLVHRVCRRLKPFDLVAGTLQVEVRRPEGASRRAESLSPGLVDEDAVREVVRTMARPMLEPTASVRSLLVRLSRLHREIPQGRLFPALGRSL
jgi:DNA polymerase-4